MFLTLLLAHGGNSEYRAMTMSSLPYSSEEEAAPSIAVLLDFLRDQDDSAYLYRGQTRSWPGPLLPSAFRRYKKTGRLYSCDSPEYAYALGREGRRFVDLVPVNCFRDSVPLFCPQNTPLCDIEMTILERIANDRYVSRTLKDGTSALAIMLTPLELQLFADRLDYWKRVIDNDHRIQIRDMVFERPFGYLLGHGLAQQYGFNSDMLDVTTDPIVAAFFATHMSPTFSESPTDGLGVIYSFRDSTKAPATDDHVAHNFYNCPPVLAFNHLLAPFVKAGDSEDLRNAVEEFLVESLREHKQWRRWDAFRLTTKLVAESRMKRQAAALLVPDMIFVEQDTSAAGKGDPMAWLAPEARQTVAAELLNGTRRYRPTRFITAVEDLATREGATTFYFHHGSRSVYVEGMTREYLWPNARDPFFEMIGNALLLTITCAPGQIVPNRIDLLDPGYRL